MKKLYPSSNVTERSAIRPDGALFGRTMDRMASAGKFLPYPPAALLPSLIAGGIFLIILALYITTLAPSVVTLFDDSLEFQLVTYQLGIAHPTGYPLYTLLGKLFTFVPVGDVAYRVNLMSAVFGAATVALVYWLVLRILSGSAGRPRRGWPVHMGGVMGALLLALGLVFWQQATVAEVYTLNAFFVVALLLLATTLPPASAQDPLTTKARERQIWWLAFGIGLSLTHHRTALLLWPALALYLYLSQRSLLFKPKLLIVSLLVGLAPLLLYLYLPLRGHIGSLDGTYRNTWAGFWQQVSASGYGLFIFDNPFGQERTLAFYWDLLRSQFYTTALGFIGIFYLLGVGPRKFLALTGLTFLTYTGFNLFYNVSDIAVFFIPVFLVWAVWSGVGAAVLLQIASTLTYRRARPLLAGGLLIIFIFIIFQLFGANRPLLSQSYTWQVHDYGLDMLQQLPAGDKATVVGILGEMTLLRYFQQTENRRPEVETIAADAEADRLAVVEKLVAQGRMVYLTRELPGAAERWSLNAVGPLIRVDPRPVTTPPNFSVQLNQALIPEIKLLGYNLAHPPHTGQGLPPLRLTLYWQATAPISANLKVSARLLTPSGEPVAASDAVPVHFAYPTSAWRPGEIVSDVYDLSLPPGTPPGPYIPLLIWYDPAQNAAELGRIELQAVTVARRR